MRECPCVQLPASFAQREGAAQLAGAALPPTVPAGTPLQRGDPSAAWYDVATVVNVLSTLDSLLRGR